MTVPVRKHKRRNPYLPGIRARLRKLKSILPKPSEIPPVPQDMLRELYDKYTRGIHDEELLDEVESRLVAQTELWFLMNKELVGYWDAHDIGLKDDWIIDEINSLISSYIPEFDVGDVSFRYEEISPVLDKLRARQSGSFDQRMLAIDTLIHFIHDRGYLANTMNIIEHRPAPVEIFLDDLAGVRARSSTFDQPRHRSFLPPK